jgi:hypothetical protein
MDAPRFERGENVWILRHPDAVFRHRAGQVRRARVDREDGRAWYTLQLADGPLLEVAEDCLARVLPGSGRDAPALAGAFA